MNAMHTPIRSPPRILAATVPRGIVGKIGLRSIPKTQRIHAPAAAPPPTATTDQPEISVPKVRLRCQLPISAAASPDEFLVFRDDGQVDVARAPVILRAVRNLEAAHVV